jgi:hypothetical protein
MIGADDICAAVARDHQKGLDVRGLAKLYNVPDGEIRLLLAVGRERYRSWCLKQAATVAGSGGISAARPPLRSSHNGDRRSGS